MELYPECPIRDCLALSSLFTFSHRTFPPGYRFAGESHDFYEAVCILGGKAEITADSRVLVLSAGEMILHPPREFHKIGTRDGSLETVIFSFRAPMFPVKGGVFSLTAEEMDRVRAMQDHKTIISIIILVNDSADLIPILNGHIGRIKQRIHIHDIPIADFKVTQLGHLV